MKLFLIGATGNIGSCILDEALSRGHQVTALTRDASKLSSADGLSVATGDVMDTAKLAEAIKGHDAVIVSYNPGFMDPEVGPKTTQAGQSILAALRQAGVKRVLWVGGAGSLTNAEGKKVMDTMEGLPPTVREAIESLAGVLAHLRTVTDLDWTFFSPAAMIGPGERTGKFRLGGEDLIVDDKERKSHISRQDYAIATLDEIETPKHIQKRFTIGY